jgi:hypothetical protein
MNFDTEAYLRRATGRAKSDVANKLVSMFLHEVSRKLCNNLDLDVADPRYTASVSKTFGGNCCYCERPLESDRAAVEHLDGMNRLRVGLHVPGNVVLACTRCNREKRRDDSAAELKLAATGWESFLSHNSNGCSGSCNSCQYWTKVWPDLTQRTANLQRVRDRIRNFRTDYVAFLNLNAKARTLLAIEIGMIYRDGQDFATTRIKKAVDDVLRELIPANTVTI